jgi:hypothetical protein
MTSLFINRTSRAGLHSDIDAAGTVKSCQPAAFMWLTAQAGCSAADRYYLLWLCAAAAPGLAGVTMLADVFAGNMLTAVAVLQQRWQDLVDDLQAGEAASARPEKLLLASSLLVR